MTSWLLLQGSKECQEVIKERKMDGFCIFAQGKHVGKERHVIKMACFVLDPISFCRALTQEVS